MAQCPGGCTPTEYDGLQILAGQSIKITWVDHIGMFQSRSTVSVRPTACRPSVTNLCTLVPNGSTATSQKLQENARSAVSGILR